MYVYSHPLPERKKYTLASEIVHQIVNKYSCMWKTFNIYREPAPDFLQLALSCSCVLSQTAHCRVSPKKNEYSSVPPFSEKKLIISVIH